MGTSILSTHTTTITMGRAAKLKRQRQLERLSSPPLPTTPTEVSEPSDLEFAQSSSDLTHFNPFSRVLNPFPKLLFQSAQYYTPLDRQFNQLISNLIEWLLTEWSTIPSFYNSFTFDQAQAFAGQSLYLLLETWGGDFSENASVEYKISDRFTILLFFHSQSLSIETKIVDNFDQLIFVIPTQFKLKHS